jgi:hypothetical protein
MSGAPAFGIELWSSDAWREQAVGWADRRLADAGLERTGETTQPHLRPWGTVLKIPTVTGPAWLKAPGPGTVFEVALYELLGRVAPDWVLPPIAVDVERGWVLLPDGGTTLGDRLDEVDLTDALVTILPRYAQLQRDLVPHVDALLSFGIADMRPAAMPARFDEALDWVGRYVDDRGRDGDREILERAAAHRDTFMGWCDRLRAGVVPASLDHNDLHPWNIFVAGDDGSEGRFYDWGDAVVSHPFASMLLGVGFIGLHLQVGQDDPRVLRARDAYLEVFTDLAPRADLVEELELACRVGKVARALTWERSIREQGYDEAGDFARAPLESLDAMLDATWMGRT